MTEKERPFAIPKKPQSLSIEQTLDALKSGIGGLSSDEAAERLKSFGKNQLEKEKIGIGTIFFRQFKNILIYVLILASMISIVLGEWVDVCVILIVVLVNSLLGFWQEVRADRSIRALKKLTEGKVRVNRDGQVLSIFSSEIVPGDCIFLKEGEIVTADIRLIEETSLLADESSMTGESVPVSKESAAILPEDAQVYDLKNMVFAGTAIVRGEGKGIAVSTGADTYFGKIAAKAQEASPETPLTKALKHFTRRLVACFCVLFLLLFVVGFFQGRPLAELAYILVAGLVSAIPEGLPLVITLVVVIGAIVLSKKNAYVRLLPSVETLGSATVIASDKTGTITEGKLIVKEWAAEDIEQLRLVGALCNDAHQGAGDPLDLALWKWIENGADLKKRFPRTWSYPFDAKEMLMAVICEIDGREALLIKGAYEALKKISPPDEKADRQCNQLLEKGYRVLAFGIGGGQKNSDPSSWRVKIAGFVGFLDPPKEGVAEAVAKAKEAHIKVLMLTGDHLMTAQSVAKEVGIWKEGDQSLTGPEIEKMTDHQLAQALKKTTVLARILPDHKYRIVKLLQANKEIVAVTGDGVNDMPALKAADLGVAMGSGAEAAKSVSEMIITDNNFRVIVEAVQRGRVIVDNIRKVLYYLLSTSLQEICLLSLSIFALLPLPLAAVQILWINLVTDGVQVQSFALIKMEGNVMRQRPKKLSEKFINQAQIWRVLVFGAGVGIFTFWQYFLLRGQFPPQLVSSIIFTSVVMAQWANGIQAQKESEPFFKNIRRSFSINPLIFAGVAGGIVLQMGAIYVFPKHLKAAPLDAAHWVYPITAFVFAFFLVEARKWIEHWRTALRP